MTFTLPQAGTLGWAWTCVCRTAEEVVEPQPARGEGLEGAHRRGVLSLHLPGGGAACQKVRGILPGA